MSKTMSPFGAELKSKNRWSRIILLLIFPLLTHLDVAPSWAFQAPANTQQKDLEILRQLEEQYLRAEVEEQLQKARSRESDPAKFIARLESLAREEELQAAELRRKSQLKVNLRLLNLLVIHQPKVLLYSAVAAAGLVVGRLEWVWDPLIEAIEAAVCPECGHPTFEFTVTRQGQLICPACAAAAKTPARPARR